MDRHFKSYNIDDRSYVAFVKREIHNQLVHSSFSKNRIAEIDIVIAELTSNLIKHAGKGELLCRIKTLDVDLSSLELVVIDFGPGMSDVQKMMKDGVSTTNTLGQGLGAISRMSDHFQIFSQPKWGTICYALILSDTVKVKKHKDDLDFRWFSVPKANEVFCGDGCAVKKSKDLIKVFVGDGLGHGEHAHEAVQRGSEYFINSQEEDPVEIIRQMHASIRKTRGLVASVGILDMKNKRWRICGVGNIVTRLYGGIMFKHYMSYNGIVGLNIPNSMKETVIEAEKNQHLIMCSDGIRSRWDLSKYPSIFKYDSMLLAATLYKDFNRRTDDTSIFVGKVQLEK